MRRPGGHGRAPERIRNSSLLTCFGAPSQSHHNTITLTHSLTNYTSSPPVSLNSRIIALSEIFNGIILVAIIIAGALVGIQTYPGMETDTLVVTVDNIILVTFCVEVGEGGGAANGRARNRGARDGREELRRRDRCRILLLLRNGQTTLCMYSEKCRVKNLIPL